MTTLAARPAPPAPPLRATRPLPRRSDAGWNLAAVTVIWITSLIVASLWLSGGGMTSLLAGGAETLNSLGRLAGLVAANLLLYQVLLMARIPLFEKGFGRDAITRLHRGVGFWSLWLMLAHIVLQVFGYSLAVAVSPWAQLWEFIWEYPGMLLATAGTLLILLVAVTSIRRARRRLRYESWHLLHLYAYLGVGLAVPHMLWTGGDFLVNPVATAYWWTLWAVTAAAVVVFRVAVPLTRSTRHGIRVRSVEPDGTDGVAVRMSGRALSRLRADSGQFFVWRFLDGPGWSRGHPFSLAAAPRDDELVIAAKMVGDGTRRLATLRSGTRVLIEGPYGHMTGRRRVGDTLLMIGAGAGVAPLVSILESERFAPGAATLLTRDHSDAALMCAAAIDRLRTERGLRHVRLDGPRSRSGSPWLPESHSAWKGADVLRYLAPQVTGLDVYLCGPTPWMDAVRSDLRAAGVPSDRIHSEAFTV